MAVQVRLAREDELEAVGELTVVAYRDDGFIPAGDDYLEELADAATRAREAELWVAVDDSGVLGSVTFCAAGTRFVELAEGRQGEFRMLGVAHHARRRGVAEALVRRCIARCQELGYDALVMSSMREMGTAHRLYERLGFVRMPEKDWSPAAGVDLLAFVKALD